MKRKSIAKTPGAKRGPKKSASVTDPTATANGATKPFAEYMTASFTRRLLEHAHRAKKAALQSKKDPKGGCS